MPALSEGVLDAVERAPLSLTRACRVQEALVSGELAEEVPPPSEGELGRRPSVGRSTAREAVRILEARGLVALAKEVLGRLDAIASRDAGGAVRRARARTAEFCGGGEDI